MTQLEIDSKTEIQAQESAALIMDAVPLIMRVIRTEMRRYRPADLSVPQFRSLTFVRRNPGTSLSDVAEHVGLTLPSVSKMVDGLQERNLLKREIDAQDRRKITLNLTEYGQSTLQAAQTVTQTHLTKVLAQITPDEQLVIAQAMRMLRTLFSEEE